MPRKKPPIGVMPRFLWTEHHPDPTPGDHMARALAVAAAIHRYIKAGRLPLPEWVDECAAASFAAGLGDGLSRPRSPEPSEN